MRTTSEPSAAGEREFGEELGNPLIENRAVIAAGLVTEGTSKPRFAHAGRPAQNQIVVRVDPLAIGELVEERAVEAARGAVIDVLDASRLAQSGIAQPGGKPLVAAVKGWTFGGGFEIALNCDIRVASKTVKFAAPEVKHGWLGAGGFSQRLTRLVGYGQASRILLTGEPIDGPEAYRIGVVEFLVEEGEELAAEELRAAAYSLGRLLGRVDVEDILDVIFREFCVGK